jgi:hypothetical protein
VGNQVKDIFLQVGGGTGDRVNLSLANHLGQGNSQLGRTHGAGQRDQHFASLVDVVSVSLGCRQRLARIEVAKMSLHEL